MITVPNGIERKEIAFPLGIDRGLGVAGRDNLIERQMPAFDPVDADQGTHRGESLRQHTLKPLLDLFRVLCGEFRLRQSALLEALLNELHDYVGLHLLPNVSARPTRSAVGPDSPCWGNFRDRLDRSRPFKVSRIDSHLITNSCTPHHSVGLRCIRIVNVANEDAARVQVKLDRKLIIPKLKD